MLFIEKTRTIGLKYMLQRGDPNRPFVHAQSICSSNLCHGWVEPNRRGRPSCPPYLALTPHGSAHCPWLRPHMSQMTLPCNQRLDVAGSRRRRKKFESHCWGIDASWLSMRTEAAQTSHGLTVSDKEWALHHAVAPPIWVDALSIFFSL
jgi:hypothetical protein